MIHRVDLAASSIGRLCLLRKVAARAEGRDLLRLERKIEDLSELLNGNAEDLVRLRHEVAELQRRAGGPDA
jgi:hypothetical protein